MYGYYSNPTFTTTAPQYFVGNSAGLNTKNLTYWQNPKRYKTHTPIEIAAQQFKHADELARQAEASFRPINFPQTRYVVNHTAPHPTTFVHNPWLAPLNGIYHWQNGLLPWMHNVGHQFVQLPLVQQSTSWAHQFANGAKMQAALNTALGGLEDKAEQAIRTLI